MLKVGITGGIGAGKSFICEIFKRLGIPVYDADQRAKMIMVSDNSLIAAIKEKFGADAYQINGDLNRQYLAKKVFINDKEVSALNKLVHPRVARDFEDWVQRQSSKYVIKEAALLIETGSYKQLDHLILVTAKKDQRLHRIAKRDPQRDEEQILAIIKSQISDVEASEYADSVIENNGNVPLLEKVLALHDQLLKLA